jgi:predicted LppA-like lipoprotein
LTTTSLPEPGPAGGAGGAAHHRCRAVALLALSALTALLLLAGCAPGSPTTPTEQERMDRATELAARQPSDQAVARYEQMLHRIRDELDSTLGPHTWHPYRPQHAGGCGSDFPSPDGRIVQLQTWGFDATIPDTDWPTATRIVSTIANDYGFTTPQPAIDKPAPGNGQPALHSLSGTDSDLGASYQLTTNIDTVIAVTTGCHPTPKAARPLVPGPPSPTPAQSGGT